MEELLRMENTLMTMRQRMTDFSRLDERVSEYKTLNALMQTPTRLRRDQYKRHGVLDNMNKELDAIMIMLDSSIVDCPAAVELGGDFPLEELVKAKKILERADDFLFQSNFTGTHDADGAIIQLQTIGKGASLESALGMMVAIYSAFAEKTGFSYEVLDSNGSEATLRIFAEKHRICGPFGYLKTENGTHKRVMVEDKQYKNQIVVSVIPDVEKGDIEIDEDLFRYEKLNGTGNGGQNVNKTKNGCRISYRVPGEDVLIQAQSRMSSTPQSQRNAERVLRARIADYDERKRQESARRGAEDVPLIRRYDPDVDIVKDYRTGAKANFADVMNGGLMPLIRELYKAAPAYK